MYEFFIEPFTSFLFLKRALVACLGLSMSCAPVGVLVVLRRMSLMGDALSHSILPGVAIGFLVSGLSLTAMSIGGFISALTVALLAGIVSRTTLLREDASLVGFYLISLAFGSLLVSIKGNNVDLMHILFGTILAVDQGALLLISSITTFTLIVGAIIYRPLIIECFDSGYMRSLGPWGSFYHGAFIVIIVLCMVAAFQALGALMALGMMMLPAISSRFWARDIWIMFLISFFIALVSGYVGLLLSYHYAWQSGPSIVLFAGVIYIFSLIFGRYGSLRQNIA
ncbi:MAG: metal ABC transporter permease [Alphaproteobacteria bacterium]|nr:metal ABC transporter permease [Alphaproteobacteria bacterium]